MAPSQAPVFLTGESGTGKELAAEAIHAHAGAQERPFVAINCSAIPRELMESEIFGHVRGAFTGATEHRAGAAELADGGTLFLDEIAEMDLRLQAKLLRFVQSGTLRRVGGTEQKRVSVRIVSATNRDPLKEVEAGRFRADLFYRLHVLPIHLPPLRERRDDIPLLAEHFLAGYAAEEGSDPVTLDADTLAALTAHDWPGNVRELANMIRRMVVLGGGADVPDAPPPVARRGGPADFARSDGRALLAPGAADHRGGARRLRRQHRAGRRGAGTQPLDHLPQAPIVAGAQGGLRLTCCFSSGFGGPRLA